LTSTRWLGAVLVLTACGGSESPPADSLIDVGRPEVEAAEQEPTSLADIAPGDTAGVLSLIRRTIREGDASLLEIIPRDTTLPAGTGLMDRELTLWMVGDEPRKLVATEPNRNDRIFPETTVWFVAGEAAVVSDEEALYFFDAAGELVIITDVGLVPFEITRSEKSTIEIAVLDSVRARLAVFEADN
jgi:hypothetical protein